MASTREADRLTRTNIERISLGQEEEKEEEPKKCRDDEYIVTGIKFGTIEALAAFLTPDSLFVIITC